MSDSIHTKRVLADAMKELMGREPFAKISVGDICQLCGMNRKSFYYHFRDKYDLVNWIFQAEFLSTVQANPDVSTWDLIRKLCDYFFENRAFYRNALSVQGQNSFQDYFREVMEPVMQTYAEDLFPNGSPDEAFFIDFYADAFIAAMLRWLSGKQPMPPDRFTELLRRSIRGGSALARLPEDELSAC